MPPTPHRGFIALISAIIITAILTAIISASSLSGFFAQFNVLDSEYKTRSRALAEACAHLALLRITEDPSYNGDETIFIKETPCSIRPVITTGTQKIVEVQSVVRAAYTNIRIIVDTPLMTISSKEELENF